MGPSMATMLKVLYEPKAMTRCECADLPFEEIRRRMERGQSLCEITKVSGCGQTCTACLPDLKSFLEQHRLDPA
jgi:bacterioferritin-associated ferredoxin